MICKRCGIKKPYTNEFFPERTGGYLRKTCNICWRKKRTEYKKEWRENHKERDFQNRKEWYKKNPSYLKEWMKNKRKNDVNFKIASYYRNRVLRALKNYSKGKQLKTIELIGCSIDELKKHLEINFKEGMTWENYGYNGWHVDHIIPCSKFNLSNIEEQKKCFNFKNLQPLWAYENFKKSNS